MACKCIILESADIDRENAITYLIAATGGTKAASDFLADVNKMVANIREFPTMYAVSHMPELAEKGFRVAFAGSYALLYTFENETIFIEHIFHQRQDYAHMV